MKTGYFVDTEQRTKTHLVGENNKPLCGANIKNKEFQWCANDIIISYIDCESCTKHAKKILENRNETISK